MSNCREDFLKWEGGGGYLFLDHSFIIIKLTY